MCINLKKKLSTTENFSLYLDCFDGKDSNFCLSLTRNEFDDLNKQIFDRALDLVKQCLSDIQLSETDIEEVVLVGGSTRIPKIRDILSTHFGRNKLKTDLNPDEAVAAGASIYAACLKGEYRDLEKYKVTEVTPMTLGLIGDGELVTRYISKNSPLPATGTRTFVTVNNDQKSLLFRVFEGERKQADFNNKLGEFRINDLPSRRAGDVSFCVKFNLDEDGILNVTASEESTGKSNQLVVTMGQFRFSERKIKDTYEDAKRHKYEDDTFETFILLRNKLQLRCRHVLYDLKKISSAKDKDFVEKSCKEFLEFTKELNFTDIDRLEAKFATIRNSILSILKDNSMLELE
ncbi:hypothetical protein NQ314_017386 [Rhamnusium bicolor]|uniref:Heat shock protein 70 n=1 Tax=Rhamnusium bicolor TaxID=1586634 RepID=A0AAV8WUF2_9CUCU|nr:hypothetical protein NQ314_017386 [Rhamnusium bicolor]